MTKFLSLELKNRMGGILNYGKLYLLIFVFIISFNSVVFAQEDIQYLDSINNGEFDEFLEEDKGVSFFYLLGALGYNDNNIMGIEVNGQQQVIQDDFSLDGFAFQLTGGWQVMKYFAMELAVAYRQSSYDFFGISLLDMMNVDTKYTLLFQPYLKIDNSWSIMPKIGAGVSLIGSVVSNGALASTVASQSGFGFGGFGTIGLRAVYKKFIFGISYELGGSAIYYPTETITFLEHRVMFEAGIKF